MYNEEMLKTIDNLDRHCSEISCILSSLYYFLVRHNRMLNPWHKVNEQVNYWNKF